MTNHVARLYLVALALVAFFLTWAVVAARPWATAATAEKDPRLTALERRETRLRRESVRVQRVVNGRFARYEVRLRKRREAIAAIEAANASASAAPVPVASSSTSAVPAAPSVGVVELPPVTNTSSS